MLIITQHSPFRNGEMGEMGDFGEFGDNGEMGERIARFKQGALSAFSNV